MSTTAEIEAIIRKELPEIIVQDLSMRDFVLRTVSQLYAGKQETESKFDRILSELQQDREEQARKWAENSRRWDEFTREQNQKWYKQNRKWEEQNQKNNEILLEIKKMNQKHDSTLGAIGSRWGLNSEASFRNALKGILEGSFGVQVLNIIDFDDNGEVFGRADQIEIDIIIKNGITIACEIKSSMSKSDVYTFERKIQFYQKHHGRTVNRKMVISPMVEEKALVLSKELGIEVYSYAGDVTV